MLEPCQSCSTHSLEYVPAVNPPIKKIKIVSSPVLVKPIVLRPNFSMRNVPKIAMQRHQALRMTFYQHQHQNIPHKTEKLTICNCVVLSVMPALPSMVPR